MNDQEKKEMIARYQDRLNEFGPTVQALSSGNSERQKIRFENLIQIGSLNGSTILDFGCGLADFYSFLISEGFDIKYTGVDLVPEFISSCKLKFKDANFVCEDIFETDFLNKNKFDYIFASQVFNRKLRDSNNLDYAKKSIVSLLNSAKKGIAIDFLTDYVDFKENHLFYYSPEELYSFAKSLSKRVTLKSDYPLYEFTLFIYSDFKGWR